MPTDFDCQVLTLPALLLPVVCLALPLLPLLLAAALAQQEGPMGLSVAQLWLSRLLQQLSSRVAAYTSITQLAQTPAQAAAAAAAGLLPRPAKGDAPSTPAPFGDASSNSEAATASWLGSSEPGSSSSSSWWWWGSSSGTGAGAGSSAPSPPAAPSAGFTPGPGLVPPAAAAAATLSPGAATTDSSSSSSSWYWPFSSSSSSGAPEAASDGAAAGPGAGFDAPTGGSSSAGVGLRSTQQGARHSSALAQRTEEEEALIESARASIWRDAAPVTAASAKAAADDLRAAANAMLNAWLGAAGSLALPSDMLPGMFVPAVVEAYPAAARVVDCSVAQQRTCQVLEVSGWCCGVGAGGY